LLIESRKLRDPKNQGIGQCRDEPNPDASSAVAPPAVVPPLAECERACGNGGTGIKFVSLPPPDPA